MTAARDADFWPTLGALVDVLFPADETGPAATEFGVLDYMRRHLDGDDGQGRRGYRQPPFASPEDAGHGWQHDLSHEEVYRAGLRALDRAARRCHDVSFAELAPERQVELVAAVDCDEVRTFGDIGGPDFLALVREHLVEGLFTDPRHGGNRQGAGWRWLGYAGPPTLEEDLSLTVLPSVDLTAEPRP